MTSWRLVVAVGVSGLVACSPRQPSPAVVAATVPDCISLRIARWPEGAASLIGDQVAYIPGRPVLLVLTRVPAQPPVPMCPYCYGLVRRAGDSVITAGSWRHRDVPSPYASLSLWMHEGEPYGLEVELDLDRATMSGPVSLRTATSILQSGGEATAVAAACPPPGVGRAGS